MRKIFFSFLSVDIGWEDTMFYRVVGASPLTVSESKKIYAILGWSPFLVLEVDKNSRKIGLKWRVIRQEGRREVKGYWKKEGQV
jgi:hypothetical protein